MTSAANEMLSVSVGESATSGAAAAKTTRHSRGRKKGSGMSLNDGPRDRPPEPLITNYSVNECLDHEEDLARDEESQTSNAGVDRFFGRGSKSPILKRMSIELEIESEREANTFISEANRCVSGVVRVVTRRKTKNCFWSSSLKPMTEYNSRKLVTSCVSARDNRVAAVVEPDGQFVKNRVLRRSIHLTYVLGRKTLRSSDSLAID